MNGRMQAQENDNPFNVHLHQTPEGKKDLQKKKVHSSTKLRQVPECSYAFYSF